MRSRKYTKKDIIKILHQSAKKYQENLLNKKIIFIFKNKDNLDYIEILFKDSNFMHLTGIKYKKGANQFFIDCIQSKIKSNDIEIKNEIFTFLKLQILENAMSINKSAKRIGIYNNGKTNIKIEKVIGNTHYCLGFSNLNNNRNEIKYYYPKTLFQDNLKNNVLEEYKIVAILSKNKNDKLYNEITYLSRSATLEVLEDKKILEKLDYKNLKP